jgi:hypothetical protein
MLNVAMNTLNIPAKRLSAPGIGLEPSPERSTLLVE